VQEAASGEEKTGKWGKKISGTKDKPAGKGGKSRTSQKRENKQKQKD